MKNFTPRYQWILLCLCLSISWMATSQNQISGLITDQANVPIPYVNVLLLSPLDSSLIQGNISELDGSYSFADLVPGDYLLSTGMIGYQTQYSEKLTLKNEPGELTLPVIQLSENTAMLSEVEVVEKKALFEQQIDRLVVNVENSINLTGTTALDVLKRSPGVSVNPQSNTISMSGKDGVVVMLNGKISRMPADAVVQMLDGMNSDNIEKIELIHTPPSNFDAQGNAGFINIVMKKSQEDGFNGGFSLNAGYGKKEKTGASFNLNWKKNKVNWFADYSWRYNNNPQLFANYRGFKKDNTSFFTGGESTRNPTRVHVQNARMGVDIRLSDKTVLGALTTWSSRYWTMDAVNNIQNLQNEVLTSGVVVVNDEINHDNSYLANLNLEHQFSEKTKLNVDLDYASFVNDNPSNYSNEFYDENEQLLNKTQLRVSKKNPLDIWVGKVDFTHKLNNEMVWEFGLKGTRTSFENDIVVEDLIESVWTRSEFFSSKANMSETVGAAYSSMFWKLTPKIDVKIGLRFEYADILLGTVAEPKIVDRKNGRFFPSIFIANQINEDNQLQLSYSRRINRPGFNLLAPWFIFFDPTTVQTGNPTLLASISDAFRLNYNWKTVQFGLQYTYNDDMIGRFQPDVDVETNTQVNGAKNFLNAHLAAINVSFPLKFTDWWSMRTGWTGQWAKVNDVVDEQAVSFSNASWNLNTSMTFQLPKKFSVEVNQVYFSPVLFGLVKWEEFHTLDIGVQKELPGEHGKIKVAVSDIFVGGNYRGRLDDPQVNFTYEGYYGFAERVFRVTYSRNFGNKKLKKARNRSTGSAEEQRRVN